MRTVPAPSALPLPTGTTRTVSPVIWRYAYNVCTYGYTMAWWDWRQWEEELDRLALWGVNLPLAFAGQESIFLRAFVNAGGLAKEDVTAGFFAGPAFAAWQRMGNIKRWAGPLTDDWMAAQVALAHAILGRMREYGMQPIIPGFAGHVPDAMQAKYPAANFTRNHAWGNFNATYSEDLLLEPTDPLFATLGTAFYREWLAEFGPEPSGQMFAHPCVPTRPYLCRPADGKPFIWNMLQVFGGRRGIYGNLPVVANGPVSNRTAPGSTMVGVGFTPEATEITSVTFDLLFEMGWRADAPDLTQWIAGYVARRYGVVPPPAPLLSAWTDYLLPGAYSSPYDYGTTENFCVLEGEPQLTYTAGVHGTNADAVLAALRLFLEAAGSSSGALDPATNPQFRYDLIDLARQVACDVGWDVAVTSGAEMLRFMNNGVNTTAQVAATTATLRSLIASLDSLLTTDTNFLAGHWIADAVRWAAPGNATEAAWLSFNARNQITLWGPDGEIEDYAAKNGWAGLVGVYYQSRWDLHAAAILGAVSTGTPVDWAKYTADLLALERAWSGNTSMAGIPTEPAGDALAATQALVAVFASGDPAGYTAYPNYTGGGQPLTQLWHRDVGVLLAVCDADPGCTGVSSDGSVWVTTASTKPAAGVTLYIKKAQQQQQQAA